MAALPEIEIDLAPAQQISGQLGEARKALGLSQKEVAYKLLLSPDQINCLECCSLKSFYGPQYYVQAARKYADFLGVEMAPPKLLTDPTPAGIVSSPDQPFSAKSPTIDQRYSGLAAGTLSRGKTSRGYRLLLFVAALIVVMFAGLAVIVKGRSHDRNNLLALPDFSTAPVEKAAPTHAASEQAGSTVSTHSPAVTPVTPRNDFEKVAASELQLSFSAPTWVKFTRRDGSYVQKIYGLDGALKLDVETLTELIIGNAPATRLRIGKSEINLGRYTKPDSKVAYIGDQNLRDLGRRQ